MKAVSDFMNELGRVMVFALIACAICVSVTFKANAAEVEIVSDSKDRTVKDVSELSIKFMDGSNGIYEYTGNKIEPSVSFYMDNIESNQISQYDSLKITYGANIEPGKGTVTIIGLGGAGTDWQYIWVGTKTFEFDITKANIYNEFHDASIGIYGSYHDNAVFSKNIKNFIKGLPNLPSESIKAIDKASIKELKLSSSNKNIFKIKKNQMVVTGVGIAYLNFTIPETKHYNSYSGKSEIIVYPPRADYRKFSKKLEKGNSIRFGITSGLGAEKSKTNFKCKVIIATSKSFKKSSIIKSYTLSKKEFDKQKIKRIKSKKFKKGKNFYIKTYTYRKLPDGRTMYGEMNIYRFKIKKNGKISYKSISDKEPYIK